MLSALGNQAILFLLVGVFGFIVGALLTILFTGRGRQENEPVEPKRRPGEVSVWHEGALSRIITEMDGKTFTSPKELTSEQRQRLVRLLRDWASWLEVTPQRPAQAPAASVETPAPAAAPLRAMAAPALKAERPARPSAPPPTNDGKQPATNSIVVQVNNILQEMLDSGSAKAKGIRLVEDPRNGVTVWVGLNHYDSIDAVEDPECLTLIRAAVAEWERRAGGKSA